MKTTYLKESIMYDCAASELTNIIFSLRKKYSQEADKARSAGEEPPQFYDLIISDVSKIRNRYRKQSNALYRRHKELVPDLDEDGIENLMCALAKSWAEDYEKALCYKDDYRERRIEKLLAEAENVVTPNIVSRIERSHNRFVKMANDKIGEIVEDTEEARRIAKSCHTIDHHADTMRNRCPCCGGGLYARKLNTNVYRVQCPSCSLFEIVKVVL